MLKLLVPMQLGTNVEFNFIEIRNEVMMKWGKLNFKTRGPSQLLILRIVRSILILVTYRLQSLKLRLKLKLL